MTIRQFELRDQSDARHLILEGLGEHFGSVDETLNPDLNDIAARYAGALFLVAVSDGELVGTGALVHAAREVAQVVRMSVAARRRRTGIGRAILGRLLEQARLLGYRWVILGTNDDWGDANAFYSACGFTEIGRGFGGVGFALSLQNNNRRPGWARSWTFLPLLLWRRLRPRVAHLRHR